MLLQATVSRDGLLTSVVSKASRLTLFSPLNRRLPEGLGFILDRNRINVAVSRVQCLAIVVGDPRIANCAAGSIGETMLLNLFCKVVE